MTLTRALLGAALLAARAIAQDPGLPPPQPRLEVRERTIPTERRAPARIANQAELEALLLFPPGYRLRQEGRTFGDVAFVVERMELFAPDGRRRYLLTRHEGPTALRIEAGRLVAQVDGAARAVGINPTRQLHELLEREVAENGPGVFELRAWTLDLTGSERTTRSLIVDGVSVATPRAPHRWATMYGRVGKRKRERVWVDKGRLTAAWPRARVTLTRHTPKPGIAGAVGTDD